MTEPANAAQIDYWNATAGATWVELNEALDRQLAPLGEAAIAALGPRPGERILDIGCGAGATTAALAAMVGSSGAVTGVDVSKPLLEAAVRRGSAARFVEADAQTADLGAGAFDALFSRFGVMFFEDPAAAFTNLRRALKPGGRLAFVCWRGLADNAWMREPIMAAIPLLPPLPQADPLAPGPFAFADPERVRGILGEAGFTAVAIDAFDTLLATGGDLDAAVTMALKVGPLGRALADNPGNTGKVVEAVRAALAHFLTPEGVRMPAAVWIVTASA